MPGKDANHPAGDFVRPDDWPVTAVYLLGSDECCPIARPQRRSELVYDQGRVDCT